MICQANSAANFYHCRCHSCCNFLCLRALPPLDFFLPKTDLSTKRFDIVDWPISHWTAKDARFQAGPMKRRPRWHGFLECWCGCCWSVWWSSVWVWWSSVWWWWSSVWWSTLCSSAWSSRVWATTCFSPSSKHESDDDEDVTWVALWCWRWRNSSDSESDWRLIQGLQRDQPKLSKVQPWSNIQLETKQVRSCKAIGKDIFHFHWELRPYLIYSSKHQLRPAISNVSSFIRHSFIHFLNSQFSRTNAAEVHKHPLESARTSSNSQQETRRCQDVKMKKPWWQMTNGCDSLTNWLSEWVIAFYTSQFGLSRVTWLNGYHQIRPWLLGC